MTRVLIVDDKEENLYYLAALLGANGCTVQSAHHGAEALTKARQAPPEIVISDLLMPVMDGYTLLRHWKADARLKKVPFIVYTATYTEPEDEQLALNLGADAFILKPAEPDAFLARLRQVQDNAAASLPAPPHQAMGDELGLFREYSETLIRKLEEKSMQLEETNRALQRAERDASERAAVLDALFASVPDVVTHVDLDGNIQLINRVVSPADRARVLGTSWPSSGPLDQGQAMKHAFDAVISTGKAISFESSFPGTNGDTTTHWNTLAPVVRDGKISGVVVVARDITERKQTEAQLIVSDRMASLGTLAAGVAHEINNPLACVTAYLALASEDLETLGKRYPVPSELIDEVRDAREGAERVRTIVRDLRIFSRAEDAKSGPVNVEQVLESTLRMTWNEIRHRARLTKAYGKVPPVAANEARLGQVFLNLVVNAAQAIPEGNYARNEVRIETRVDSDSHRVVVSISDTGAGIPADVQRRLFTPFVTTKPAGIGTGLGLSICHRIVTALGGAIDFTSEVGKGTTFRVALPIADLEAVVEIAAPADPARASRRGSVLIIDDDPMITHSVQRLLASDHDVRVLDGAEAALELIKAGQRFDVVLCDLMMPQVTGMDLYGALVALDRKQAAQMVFMTGGAFTPAARAFLDGVPNLRIEKPFEIQQLRALVNGLVQ